MDKIKKVLDNTTMDEEVIDHAISIKNKFRTSVATAMSAAFGFILALYWKDIVVESVNKMVKSMNLRGDGYMIRIVAAIIVTLICVSAIYAISKWGEKNGPSK